MARCSSSSAWEFLRPSVTQFDVRDGIDSEAAEVLSNVAVSIDIPVLRG